MPRTSTEQELPPRSTGRLPTELSPLFWDCSFDELDFAEHEEFVIGRILSDGSDHAVRWLRSRISDKQLRGWIEHRDGRGLSPPQLRYWELLLGIPKDRVDAWITARGGVDWRGRAIS